MFLIMQEKRRGELDRLCLQLGRNDTVEIPVCGQNQDHSLLSQIRDKKYDRQYELSQKKIFLNGVRFDTKTGQIADWQTEFISHIKIK